MDDGAVSRGDEARRIVSEGLEAGLGRDDIAGDLAEAARGVIADRSPAYWDVVAGSFVGRGRPFGQLSAYAEAAITRYRIMAVLDEVTTPTCRFLDGGGRTWRTGSSRRSSAAR